MELNIKIAENGFVIEESMHREMKGRIWAFETPESLSKYMLEWGHKNKVIDSPKVAKVYNKLDK